MTVFYVSGSRGETIVMDSSNSIKTSVIIAAYNCFDSIGDAIKSVISQTVQSFEIIICDDCSQDRTFNVISYYADQDDRVRILRNAENRGPSYSRNRALSIAEGEWIVILDADDLFEKNRLHNLLNIAVEASADIIFDNMILIDQRGHPIGKAIRESRHERFFSVSPVDFIRRDASLRFSYGFLKPMIRRSFLSANQICYRETVRYGEDFVFILDCLSAGAHAVITTRPSYYYKISPGSLSRSRTVNYYEYANNVSATLLNEHKFSANSDIRHALLNRQTHLSRIVVYSEIAALAKQGHVSSAVRRFFETAPAALFYGRLFMHYVKVKLKKWLSAK
jgi:succinoglycan biosynthesis protein ExoO